MELLTDEIRAKLPALYTHENASAENIPVVVKFFTPDGSWTWYATEFDGTDLFFGLVNGFEAELGYFSLNELRSVRGALGLPIERDLYFGDHTLAECQKAAREGRPL